MSSYNPHNWIEERINERIGEINQILGTEFKLKIYNSDLWEVRDHSNVDNWIRDDFTGKPIELNNKLSAYLKGIKSTIKKFGLKQNEQRTTPGSV